MGSADIYLKRAVLGLSIVLVLLLAGAAIYSLFSTDEQAVSPDSTVQDEPAAAVAYPGERLEIDDAEFPLTISCIRDRSTDDDIYLVVIENRGATASDYLVSASLSDAGGTSVQAFARADELRPGEARELVLLPDDDLANPSQCVINAVQGDRRVLLNQR